MDKTEQKSTIKTTYKIPKKIDFDTGASTSKATINQEIKPSETKAKITQDYTQPTTFKCYFPIQVPGKKLAFQATLQLVDVDQIIPIKPTDPRPKAKNIPFSEQLPEFFQVKDTSRPVTPGADYPNEETSLLEEIFNKNTETLLNKIQVDQQEQSDELVLEVTPDDKTFVESSTNPVTPQIGSTPANNNIETLEIHEESESEDEEGRIIDEYIPTPLEALQKEFDREKIRQVLQTVQAQSTSNSSQNPQEPINNERQEQKDNKKTNEQHRQEYNEYLQHLKDNPHKFEQLAMENFQRKQRNESQQQRYAESRERSYYSPYQSRYRERERNHDRGFPLRARPWQRRTPTRPDNYTYFTDEYEHWQQQQHQ
jgi:hypothetical protein